MDSEIDLSCVYYISRTVIYYYYAFDAKIKEYSYYSKILWKAKDPLRLILILNFRDKINIMMMVGRKNSR